MQNDDKIFSELSNLLSEYTDKLRERLKSKERYQYLSRGGFILSIILLYLSVAMFSYLLFEFDRETKAEITENILFSISGVTLLLSALVVASAFRFSQLYKTTKMELYATHGALKKVTQRANQLVDYDSRRMIEDKPRAYEAFELELRIAEAEALLHSVRQDS